MGKVARIDFALDMEELAQTMEIVAKHMEACAAELRATKQVKEWNGNAGDDEIPKEPDWNESIGQRPADPPSQSDFGIPDESVFCGSKKTHQPHGSCHGYYRAADMP